VVQIVCVCKKLVEVRDKTIIDHQDQNGNRCFSSGMQHLSSRMASAPGAPEVEIIALRSHPCKRCGEPQSEAMVKVTNKSHLN
jgi:hypothetical protein